MNVRYLPYRFAVKVWVQRNDPMPDFWRGEDGEIAVLSAIDADTLIAKLKVDGHHADRYEWLRGPCNVFGGAAARDDVRVDENGIYRPLPPTGTFS